MELSRTSGRTHPKTDHKIWMKSSLLFIIIIPSVIYCRTRRWTDHKKRFSLNPAIIHVNVVVKKKSAREKVFHFPSFFCCNKKLEGKMENSAKKKLFPELVRNQQGKKPLQYYGRRKKFIYITTRALGYNLIRDWPRPIG